MKHLLRLLIHIYPRRWRDRYGDEFDALIDDMEPRWADATNLLLNALETRSTTMKVWHWIAVGALAGFGAHLAGMYVYIPAGYSSRAVVGVGAAGPTAEKHVDSIAQRILSRRNVEELIRAYHLDTSGKTMDQAVQELSEQVRIEGFHSDDPAHSAFSIRVLSPNPQTAQKMSAELMTRFIDENIRPGSSDQAHPVFEVINLPTLPQRPARWANAEDNLGHGALFGALVGLTISLGIAAWRRFRSA